MKNDKKSSLKSHSLKYNISLRAQTPDRFWTFLESQMLAFLIEKLFLIAPKQQLKFFLIQQISGHTSFFGYSMLNSD